MHHTELRGRQIRVELSAGGGGNNERRRQKIKAANQRLGQERRAHFERLQQQAEGGLPGAYL